jgi:hypothetical protein
MSMMPSPRTMLIEAAADAQASEWPEQVRPPGRAAAR